MSAIRPAHLHLPAVSVARLHSVFLAPLRAAAFLADCALRPRPWDAAAFKPGSRPR